MGRPSEPERDGYAVKHGIEQELQIIAPGSLELVHGRVGDLLQRLRPRQETNQFADFGQDGYSSQLEYWVGIFATPGELLGKLTAFRRAVVEEAQTLGLGIMGCGVNPLSTTLQPGENFGEHHHLGVESVRHALLVYSMLRFFVPELIAFSANSPFHGGESQNVCSFRLHRTHHCMCPPRLSREDVAAIAWLSHTHTGQPERMWDVTPFVKMGRGTVEARLFDVSPSCRRSAAFACLLQGLTARVYDHEQRLMSEPQEFITSLAANRAACIASGLDAILDLRRRPILPLDSGIMAREALYEALRFCRDEIAQLGRGAGGPRFDAVGCVEQEIERRHREVVTYGALNARAYAEEMVRQTREEIF